MDEVQKFCEQYQANLDCYMYGGEQIVIMGAPTHKLTVTATITGAVKAKATLKGTKDGAEPISDEIEFNSGVAKELQGIEGYNYTWEVSDNVSWTTSAPAAFTCSEDKTIALALTVS